MSWFWWAVAGGLLFVLLLALHVWRDTRNVDLAHSRWKPWHEGKYDERDFPEPKA